MPWGTFCHEAWSLPGSSHPESVYVFKWTLGREIHWGAELYQAQKIPQAEKSWQLREHLDEASCMFVLFLLFPEHLFMTTAGDRTAG